MRMLLRITTVQALIMRLVATMKVQVIHLTLGFLRLRVSAHPTTGARQALPRHGGSDNSLVAALVDFNAMLPVKSSLARDQSSAPIIPCPARSRMPSSQSIGMTWRRAARSLHICDVSSGHEFQVPIADEARRHRCNMRPKRFHPSERLQSAAKHV